jgi:hypothetical protein
VIQSTTLKPVIIPIRIIVGVCVSFICVVVCITLVAIVCAGRRRQSSKKARFDYIFVMRRHFEIRQLLNCVNTKSVFLQKICLVSGLIFTYGRDFKSVNIQEVIE